MPRQDVPYGGAICRLKERIAEIWDRLDEKLHSINGVEGDGAGNVEIVSGDAAITVSESPTGHFIEIGLDHGNLPSATVSSVNGQTGAVRLDAVDIPSDGNSNVQADIAANKAAINECFDAITSEQAARQNADAALQGNINSVQASIPGAAAAAVANDPTVAQLAADVPGKLDKISSGNSLKAYTHTGQSQGETSIVNGTDANSIGLRDANGRMQAADPAAGATDKTLVTANWVSQTGDGAPNNLIHKIGNETKRGKLTFETNRPEGVTHQYKTESNTDEQVKRIIQRIITNDGNVTVKYLIIDSRYDNYGIASVRYDNAILNLTYTAIAGRFVPTFRIFHKDGNTYIGMDMPYHTGFTLQQLAYADNYGNNVFYSPLIDEYSTDYTEVAHT